MVGDKTENKLGMTFTSFRRAHSAPLSAEEKDACASVAVLERTISLYAILEIPTVIAKITEVKTTASKIINPLSCFLLFVFILF